jgi:hypothetical protein
LACDDSAGAREVPATGARSRADGALAHPKKSAQASGMHFIGRMHFIGATHLIGGMRFIGATHLIGGMRFIGRIRLIALNPAPE